MKMALTWVCFGLLAIAGITTAWQTDDECTREYVRTVDLVGKGHQYYGVQELSLLTKEPVFIFSVKACREARVRLTRTRNIKSQGYTMIIDTNQHDTKVMRMKDWKTSFVSKEVHDTPVLDCNEFRDFYIGYDNSSGRITLGSGHDPNQEDTVILSFVYTGPNRKHNVGYVSLSKGYGGNPSYKIYSQCPLKPLAECNANADCDENQRCVDGKCEKCPDDTMLDDGECKPVCVESDECDKDSACYYGDQVCNVCPPGTAGEIGSCRETCSESDPCSNANDECAEGFCEPCGDNEVVVDGTCVSICELKKNEGDCSNKVTRYFYKASSEQCVAFDSCNDAEGNSFASKEDCADICQPKTIPPECLLPKSAGTCEDNSRRYYYDKELMACKKFEYNGCGSNENNFLSKEDCRLYCAKYD